MTKEDMVTEVTDLTGAPHAQVASDFDSLCADWRESGLMVDTDQTPPVIDTPPRKPLAHIEWNIGATFALLDTAVAVHVPHWSALDVIESALCTLKTETAVVHHHVEIAMAGRHYAIRIDGELAGPPIPMEQLGAQYRTHFLELANRDPDRPLMYGTALAMDRKAWVVIGPGALRAALLEQWIGQGNDVIADAVVSLLDSKVLPLHLGFEQAAGQSEYLTRDYSEASCPALVNVTNDAIRYAAVSSERRSIEPTPLAAVVQLHWSQDVSREAAVLVAARPEESLLALLRSRPGGPGAISRAAAAALMRCLETAAAWSASTNLEHVPELVAAIRGGDRQQ
jgi:hypothetical protein